MSIKNKLILLSLLCLGLLAFFLLFDLPTNWTYAFEKRSIKIAAMIMVACCVAYSSVVFQTLTANRILTPSIMGFESVYVLIQTVIVFLYGDKTFTAVNDKENFFLSILMMLGFALLLFRFLFRKEKSNLYLLLLIGLVLGTLFRTLSSFLQLIIDPNEFLMLQGSMFASFNSINLELFWYALGIMLLCFVLGFRGFRNLDLVTLGRENTISLGLDYFKTVRLYLILISVLVAISTALVGPITFFGILVTNLTYELFKTYKHAILIPACCLVSCLALFCGQLVVEHVFNFNSTISVIINFVGGLYFMVLLLKVKKV